MTRQEKETLYQVWGECKAYEEELVQYKRYDEANTVMSEILTLNRLLSAFGLKEEFGRRYISAKNAHRRY